MRCVRLLIVDDSEIFAEAISERVEREPDIEVVGVAGDGLIAREMVERLSPDVITMDLQMPGLDGFGAIERIMSSVPTPILVLTGDARSQDQRGSFEALSRGALELLAKPTFVELDGPAGAQLCERVRLLAGVTVIHHARPERVVSTLAPPLFGRGSPAGVVVIGASTGGPNVVAQILGMLPAEFPLPIAIVQHLAGGFAPHFGRWLADGCELQVEIASRVSRLAPGKVLVAADERNLLINADGRRVRLTRELHGSGYCPSVDLLFDSAARCFRRRSIGIVLSGMGRDGASGVAALAAVGGTTVAQRGSTCAVDGMPAAARATGKVAHVLAPEEIGLLLLESAYDLSRFAPSARDS